MVLYFIESNLLLALLYLTYLVWLRKETFFRFNRWVLLIIPLLSLSLPLIHFELTNFQPIAANQPVAQIADFSREYYDILASWESEAGKSKPLSYNKAAVFNWPYLLIGMVTMLYVAGVIVCLSKTAWSLRWITKMIRQHSFFKQDGIKIVKLSHPTAPFSFLNFVFVHAPVADTNDFRQILDHERTHVEEKHTLDLLYVKLVAAFLWFNPFIWQLLNSLKTTHEYIADKKIIQSGYSVEEYQALLLSQLISNNSYGLVHNFNLSFIKKRITMMTNKQSGWAGRAKAGIAITAILCLSLIMIQCNSKIDDQLSLSLTPTQGAVTHVDLPILPPSGFKYQGDFSKALPITIANNTLQIGDQEVTLDELEEAAQTKYVEFGRESFIFMMVDKNQGMSFVREVEMALRKADRRKLMYIGQTSSGERVDVRIVLPPYPPTSFDEDLSKVPDEYLLKIDLGKDEGVANQKKVYDFVTGYLTQGKAELVVVSAKIDGNSTYGVYLPNLFYVKEGYIQLYQERAHKMFGKDFYQTTEDEYAAVREKIPTNISIAED